MAINAVQIVEDLRYSFLEGTSKSLTWRKAQLEAMFNMLTEEEDKICEALYADLRKCRQDALNSEILLAKSDIATLIKNIDYWSQPEKVGKGMVTMLDGLTIQKQPYGVVLVIGCWNNPVQLVIMPLAGAVAAGNCVVVKSSSISAHTAKLLAELFPKYVDQRCIRLVSGGAEVATKFLEQPLDYIFYTGNSRVGRIVMEAAAKNLTPVTLELGGKCPCYITPGTDLNMVSKRLVWGKYLNAGQTCIAPDYVICCPELVVPLCELIVARIKEFYGEDAKKSPDYGRIVSERHFDRLMKLLNESKAVKVAGGESDKSELYIAPTVLKDVTADDPVMSEELFGPILPILPVWNEEEAIYFINKFERPLAIYVFTNDSDVLERFRDRTISGGLLFNDVVLHITVEGFPFGGVGHSGMGCYHGKYSFDTFSHKRPIMYKSTSEVVNNQFRYPPYNDSKLSWVTWALGSSLKASTCTIL